MSTLVYTAATDAFCVARYGHGKDVPNTVSENTGEPEAWRFVGWNAIGEVCGLAGQIALIQGNYTALNATATTVGGLTSFSCTGSAANQCHSSALMDGNGDFGLIAFQQSGLDNTLANQFVLLLDQNWQWLFAPAQAVNYAASINGYGHRYNLDVEGRAYEAYTHPSTPNTNNLATSLTTLAGRVLPAGWQIAYLTGKPGQIFSPGQPPPAGYTGIASAQGVILEQDNTGLTSQTEGMDISYQGVGLGFLAFACLMAHDAGDTASVNAMNTIMAEQLAFFQSRIYSNGYVDTKGSCRIGFEGHPVKTFDRRAFILAAQYAGYATGNPAWWTLRDYVTLPAPPGPPSSSSSATSSSAASSSAASSSSASSGSPVSSSSGSSGSPVSSSAMSSSAASSSAMSSSASPESSSSASPAAVPGVPWYKDGVLIANGSTENADTVPVEWYMDGSLIENGGS